MKAATVAYRAPTALELIEGFPLPAAILTPTAVEFLNPRALFDVSRAWLERASPQLHALAAHEQRRVMPVANAAGRSRAMIVYAVTLADRVVAVFEEADAVFEESKRAGLVRAHSHEAPDHAPR